jgi:hypothetical protein
MDCRHCTTGRAHKARGLCFRCYQDLTIRNKYPVNHKYAHVAARTGVNDDVDGPVRLPPNPTSAPAGSKRKQSFLMRRVQLRVSLHHPDDNRLQES